MTVLRSQKIILLAIKFQTPVKTPRRGTIGIEPMTPSKSTEPSSSPTSSASTPSKGPLGLDSGSTPASGTVRRRSLRLASIRNAIEANLDAVVSGGTSVTENSSRNECELGNVEGDRVEHGVSFSGGEKVRVSDEINMEDGVPEKVIEKGETEGLSIDLNEPVAGFDVDSAERDASEFGSPSDFGGSNQVSEKDITGGEGQRKRKLPACIDLLVLDTSRDDFGDKGFLNLRSGRKVSKRRIEEMSGHIGSIGAQSAEDDTTHLARNVGLKELDKTPTGEENGSGSKARRRNSSQEKGKGKMVDDDHESYGAFLEGLKDLGKQPTTGGNCSIKTGRRASREEKGKGKVVGDDWLSIGFKKVELVVEPKAGDSAKSAVSDALSLVDNAPIQNQGQVLETSTRFRRREFRDRFRDIAKQNASRFAHFSPEAEGETPRREADREKEDWPGPFSTAMKIIKDRETNLKQQNFCLEKSKPASVTWVPKKDPQYGPSKVLIPSLQDLCMGILAKNADAITSLDCVPDILRHKLCQLLCDSRRMNCHFLDLLARGSPTEIRIRDCSWLTEEQFTRTFEGCETRSLVVLQLDQCGRCLPDYVLFTTLARSPNTLPALSTISLKGACRLSDAGLRALVTSAPALRSINLSQCSLLTSDGIDTLADSLGSVLKELYIDDCQNIDAMLVLPALLKLEHLEVLSLSGIQTVCDDFLEKFITRRGRCIKELVLTDCVKLTDSSLKVIGETCIELHALDLGNLCRLTDYTLGYLANGCRQIHTLKLSRNSFSDEAVAAYLELSGEPLRELSLNNINKVGHNTALSLAKFLRNLCSLDLSWCRNVTNEALGLIVDSCLSLKVLKLFGCTQITNIFLDGHSNPLVQIIGLKMTPILRHLKVPDPLQGPLQYSFVS